MQGVLPQLISYLVEYLVVIYLIPRECSCRSLHPKDEGLVPKNVVKVLPLVLRAELGIVLSCVAGVLSRKCSRGVADPFFFWRNHCEKIL